MSLARYTLLVVAALGFALRLSLATSTIGTNDIIHWTLFARLLREHGVLGVYAVEPLYNHPPLMGWVVLAADALSRGTGLPFAFCMKLPGLAGEVIAGVLLYRIFAARGAALAAAALALFAWNPCTVAVSGYHGNTDCLYAALALLSVYLLEHRARPFAAGLALAGAVNVKLIPVILVPAAFAACPTLAEAKRFAAGLALGALPFLVALVACGAPFLRNVLAYWPNIDRWGVCFLIGEAQATPALAGVADRAGTFYLAIGRFAVLAGAIGLAVVARVRRAKLPPGQLVAAAMATFLVLTPGFGIQYVAAAVPLLFAVDLGRGTLYSLLAGGCAIATYVVFQWHGPIDVPMSNHKAPLPIPAALLGLLAWAVLVGFVARTWRAILTARADAPA